MDFTIAVLLILTLIRTHLALVDNMNLTMQDGSTWEQEDTDEPDVFSIILKANEELIKRTENQIIEHGDILVDTPRSVMFCDNGPRSCFWPPSTDGNVYVPYRLGRGYNEFSRWQIKRSLDEIALLTCVKFYRSHKKETAYISVHSEVGCFASVGYRGSAQTISLQVPQCIFFGVIQHEFLHAIGFHHEHCRSDRNKYVRIFWENVMPDLQYNFNLLQTNNLGTEYDYDSVMHYGKTVFSRNGFPTILPIPDPRVEIGHMRGLSNKDVAKINKLYNCDVCGYMLATRIGSFTSPNFPGLYPNNADCKWLIRIARRYKIREFAGCSADQLIIYDGANHHSPILDGPICGAENPAVMSRRSELFITFTSNRKLQASGFAARYRFIRCGRMVKTRTGKIEGRSYQRKDIYCFWVLLVKRKYQIVLNFERLHIQNTTNCEQNHLIIYDAASTPPVVAARFCDKVSLPVNVISFGRAVVIEFQHTRANFNYGFKITYKSIVNKNPPTVSGSSDEGRYCNNVTFMLFISLIKITIVTFIFPMFDVSR